MWCYIWNWFAFWIAEINVLKFLTAAKNKKHRKKSNLSLI